MKKILLYGATETRGGIESFINRVVTSLQDEAEFSLVQFRPAKIVDATFYEDVLNIPIFRWDLPNDPFSRLTGRRRKVVSQFFDEKKFDIVHINENSPAAYYIAQAALESGAEVIYHSHNGYAQPISVPYIPSFLVNLPFLVKLIRSIQRYHLKKLNIKKVAVSDIAAKWMFGTTSDVSMLWNGMKMSSYAYNQKDRHNLRCSLGFDADDRIGLVAGRLVEQKNIFRALDIAKKAIETNVLDKVVFIGEGKLEQELMARIATLSPQLQEDIKYFGVQRDIVRWYAATDVLIMPSLYEGLPYSVVEAQVNGLPVVLSNKITQQVKYTNLVHFTDLQLTDDQWVQQIKQAMKDSAARADYVKLGEQSKFSGTQFKENLEELYHI